MLELCGENPQRSGGVRIETNSLRGYETPETLMHGVKFKSFRPGMMEDALIANEMSAHLTDKTPFITRLISPEGNLLDLGFPKGESAIYNQFTNLATGVTSRFNFPHEFPWWSN